jgi:hypothetical protein
MLRPEQVALTRLPAGGVDGEAVPARLIAAEVAGPNAIVTLAIATAGPGCSRLKLLTSAMELPPAGSAVALTFTGRAHVFS